MARLSEERLTSLLDLVYDASTDSSVWPTLLKKLRDVTRSEIAIAFSRDPRPGGTDHVWIDGLREDLLAQMVHYMPQDEWYHRRHLVADGRAVLGESVISSRELQRKEVYADFLRPAGMARLCCAMAINQTERAAVVSLFRRENDDEFGRDELQLMDALAPHLKRAFRIFEHFNKATELLAADALDLLSFSVFVLDGRLKLLVMNKAGEILARRGDGLFLVHGELHAAVHTDHTALETAVTRAANPTGAKARAAVVTVQRPSGEPPLRVWVVPLPYHEQPFVITLGPRVAVFVVDLERPLTASVEVMRNAFGMSPAEARLALALANGGTLREYAELQDVTLQTVRTQLQSIFGKTDTRRQSGLVRALMAALAVVRIGEG